MRALIPFWLLSFGFLATTLPTTLLEISPTDDLITSFNATANANNPWPPDLSWKHDINGLPGAYLNIESYGDESTEEGKSDALGFVDEMASVEEKSSSPDESLNVELTQTSALAIVSFIPIMASPPTNHEVALALRALYTVISYYSPMENNGHLYAVRDGDPKAVGSWSIWYARGGYGVVNWKPVTVA